MKEPPYPRSPLRIQRRTSPCLPISLLQPQIRSAMICPGSSLVTRPNAALSPARNLVPLARIDTYHEHSRRQGRGHHSSTSNAALGGGTWCDSVLGAGVPSEDMPSLSTKPRLHKGTIRAQQRWRPSCLRGRAPSQRCCCCYS